MYIRVSKILIKNKRNKRKSYSRLMGTALSWTFNCTLDFWTWTFGIGIGLLIASFFLINRER